jgi:hypothetical protein
MRQPMAAAFQIAKVRILGSSRKNPGSRAGQFQLGKITIAPESFSGKSIRRIR